MGTLKIVEKGLPWLFEAGELNVALLLIVWLLSFVSLVAVPPLVATLTGQGTSAPVYARYALLLTLVAMSVIGAPVAILGFMLLLACAAIPPLGRNFIGANA